MSHIHVPSQLAVLQGIEAELLSLLGSPPIPGHNRPPSQVEVLQRIRAQIVELARNGRPAAVLSDFYVVGASDDTLMFKAAAASGRPVLVPWRSTPYVITGQVDMAEGASFFGEVGARPQISFEATGTARLFDFNGVTQGGLTNLSINGNKDTVPSGTLIRIRDSSFVTLDDLYIKDSPGNGGIGGIVLSGITTRCLLRRVIMDEPEACGIYLSGAGVTENRIEECEVRDAQADSGGFGVFLDGGASRNLVRGCTFLRCGSEGIALTHPCSFNRIEGNHCEACDDNGISISGKYNVVVGNLCYKNSAAGIGVWGSFNAITGNVCVSNRQVQNANWAGIWVSPGYGGTAQYNTISGNLLDDDQAVPTQYSGVSISSTGGGVGVHTAWTQGAEFGPNTYCRQGLNIYKTTAGGTTGSTPPTHTEGTESDGGVEWTWVNAYISTAASRNNLVIGNASGRNTAGRAYADAANWESNMLLGTHTLRFRAANATASMILRDLPGSADGLDDWSLYQDEGTVKVVLPE